MELHDIHFEETTYGFNWGSAEVTRMMSDNKKKWIVLGVKTPKTEMQIYVTKTGKVRVFSHGEWEPPKNDD